MVVTTTCISCYDYKNFKCKNFVLESLDLALTCIMLAYTNII